MNDESKTPNELIEGKWYIVRENSERPREESVVAGPFDSIAEAESHQLPNEMLPSQYGIFQHRESRDG